MLFGELDKMLAVNMVHATLCLVFGYSGFFLFCGSVALLLDSLVLPFHWFINE